MLQPFSVRIVYRFHSILNRQIGLFYFNQARAPYSVRFSSTNESCPPWGRHLLLKSLHSISDVAQATQLS